MKTSTTRIGAAVGAVIALAIIIGLALGNGGVRSFPEGSPEAATQDFLQAMFDGDIDEARTHLSDDLAVRCDRAALRFSTFSYNDVAQITDVDADETEAAVTVVLSDDSGLLGDPYEDEHVIELTNTDGVWRITGLNERFGC